MDSTQTIHVKLTNEDVLVWRPVRAQHIGGDVYLITAQPYDSEIEQWEFQPGDRVVGKIIETSGGPTLAAVRRAD